MRDHGKWRCGVVKERELEWRFLLQAQEAATLRAETDSSFNGGNIPGKIREVVNWGWRCP